MSTTLNGTTGITFPDGSTQNTVSLPGMRNRIINGSMTIDQRNAGASVTPTSGVTYTVDRWCFYGAQSSKLTIQQNAGSVTPPAGFTKYLGVTVAAAYTPSSGENFNLQQPIEGLNVADLAWASANAQPVTVSFWVRSSLTGTFTGSFVSGGYSYVYPFTISSASTWTYVTVTIPGKTLGTFATNNNTAISFYFNLGAGASLQTTTGTWTSGTYTSTSGAVSLVSNAGATFYITGVQLEKGSTATSFDYRPYGTELALCQRYYYSQGFKFAGCVFTGSGNRSMCYIPVPMRTSPSYTISSETKNNVSTTFADISYPSGAAVYWLGASNLSWGLYEAVLTASAEL